MIADKYCKNVLAAYNYCVCIRADSTQFGALGEITPQRQLACADNNLLPVDPKSSQPFVVPSVSQSL